jgi:hypothetical protein
MYEEVFTLDLNLDSCNMSYSLLNDTINNISECIIEEETIEKITKPNKLKEHKEKRNNISNDDLLKIRNIDDAIKIIIDKNLKIRKTKESQNIKRIKKKLTPWRKPLLNEEQKKILSLYFKWVMVNSEFPTNEVFWKVVSVLKGTKIKLGDNVL